MYFYIIDNFIKDKRYAKFYHRMSMRLNDLGIFDDKIQVTKVRPIEDIVRDVLSNRNIKHIIAVGNDNTANKVINAICKNKEQEDTPAFGMIPFHQSDIAECLGFPSDIDQACTMISRRKIDKIDIGKANHDYFLTSLLVSQLKETNSSPLKKIRKLFSNKTKHDLAEIELKLENFKLITLAEQIAILNIYNSFWQDQINKKGLSLKKISPYDGLANLLISSDFRKEDRTFSELSFFTTKNIHLKSKGKVFAYLDNSVRIKFPIDVTIKMKYFNALLGKNRKF